MKQNDSILKLCFHQLFGQVFHLFVIIIRILFKIVNSGKKQQIPPINDRILLDSASTIAAKIRKRKLKSVTVVQAYISRIKDVNPLINAVVQLREEEALEEASNVDKFIESNEKSEDELEREMPFFGVPFTSKEIINVAGMSLTMGCVDRKGFVAEEDSEVVKLLKKAGAIPIGVTNVVELCLWSETLNKVYGCTNNPYDLRRTAGGSTGGEGAIIGAAGSLIGLGNDIGGSIRIPSFFNGIFGHKPTPGIVSLDGCLPFPNPELDCYLSLGPMCRYASDLLPMMKVLTGSNCESLRLNEQVNLKNLKIYYVDDLSVINFVTKTHPDVKDAVLKAVRYLENACETKAEKLGLKYFQYAPQIYMDKLAEKGGFAIEKGLKFDEKVSLNYIWELLLCIFGFSKHIFHIVFSATLYNMFRSADHSFGLAAYDDTLKGLQELLDENSVLLYPSWPEPAPYHHELIFKPVDYQPYTGLFNVLKFPVTQCPIGLSRDGLPIGIQVIANQRNDRLTIAVANELEKSFGGWISPCLLPE